MSRLRLLSGFLLALLLVGCSADADEPTGIVEIHNPPDGLWKDADEVPFKFVLEQTFGAEEEPANQIIAYVTGVTTDGDGNVYILDSVDGRIVSFTENGAFRWESGRRGEGPGEINAPYGIHWSQGSHIYLGNDRGLQVDRFDLNGQYVDSHNMTVLELSSGPIIGAPNDTTLVVGSVVGMLEGTKVSFISTSNDWSVRDSVVLGPGVGSGEIASMLPQTMAMLGTELVAGLNDSYQLNFYDPDLKLKRIVTREVDGIVPPGDADRAFYIYSSVSVAARIEDRYWLVGGQWATNVGDPDEYARRSMQREAEPQVFDLTYDLYDSDWKLLYSWTDAEVDHPGPALPVHSDVNGRIYARSRGGFPQLERYRVEVTPPD